MALLSPFQTLPMLIVEKVVEYLEERARNSFDTEYDIDIDKYNRWKVVRWLLWVSERWRVAALSVICDNCELHFNNLSNGFDVRYPALPTNLSVSQYRIERLVKRVVVSAPSWNDLGSGKFSSAFSRSALELPTFPTAATLMVCMDDHGAMYSQKTRRGNHSAPRVAESDRDKETIDFARCLRQITPAATGVIVFFRSPSSTTRKNRGQCNNLVLQLCRGNISRLYVESKTERTLPTLKLHSLTGLTSITQGLTMACAPLAQVAYLNVGTLQELNLVRLEEEEDWRTLIYGGTTTPAVYSRLTKLFLGFAAGQAVRNWAAIEDAVSFPALLEMALVGDYPFSDDLLFRGNGQTLRKLFLHFRVLARNALGRFNVFNRSGATRMNLININLSDDVDEVFVAIQSDDYIAQQIRGILEATVVLTLMGTLSAELLLRALKTAANNATVRELNVFSNRLDSSEALSIISAIPSLEILSSELSEIPSNAKAFLSSEYLSALHEKYPIANSNFRQLNVPDVHYYDDLTDEESDDSDDNFFRSCPRCGYDCIYGGCGYYDTDTDSSDSESEEDNIGFEQMNAKAKFARRVAIVAVHIAVLCPNFKHVVLPLEMREAFSRNATVAMAGRPFLPHVNTLSRLVYPQ
ncbi:hypothetical protein H4218_001435 [Coemansia sp. IMI 209128]|nr:hypothetical protein H4218_001435 [Coemansia sp. IMI 209128]